MKKYSTHRGYSLVETLVAVTILLLSIVGPMTIAAKGIQTGVYAQQQTTAIFLAQEGIEAVVAVRNQFGEEFLGTSATWDWTSPSSVLPAQCFNTVNCGATFATGNMPTFVRCTPSSACTISKVSSGRSRFVTGSAGTATEFTRKISIDNSLPDEVTVTSVVSWESGLFKDQRQVTLSTSLFDIYGN